ncbi:hypothetical protein ETAA8_06510 [Anatilimnocola aggregata]|uniref:Uncharacterized protein n=1 Tax=Anatilimnocola aggregata TaxID=2528021 RepID=A0A517Y5R7_9BACT|nr:hypothetical protein [Anatilimnocola aggregata]QDU25581.1 hypothetical protein ETAA8_06510 [Anatilimnocola aggregata]
MKRQPSKQKQTRDALARLDSALDVGYVAIHDIEQRARDLSQAITQIGYGLDTLRALAANKSLSVSECEAIDALLAAVSKACSVKGGAS